MRSIFAPSLLLVCYLHLRCANSCVLPSSRRSSIEWKTKLNYTRTGCRFTYYCVFGSCQRFVVRKSLLFFGFVRGVSVAVHTSQRPRTTYQRHDNILHTIWACKHVWQDVYARERASQHRHCVAIRDTLIPRRSTPNVAASTHWVRSIRIIHIIKTASEWYFFFFPPPPTVMPDMRRLFITRMFIFISFHQHCRWNATAALQKPIFSFVIMWCFARIVQNRKEWVSSSFAPRTFVSSSLVDKNSEASCFHSHTHTHQSRRATPVEQRRRSFGCSS